MDELSQKVLDLMANCARTTNRYELEPIAESLGAELHNGETRWAFVFKTEDFVYKFARFERTRTDYCEVEYNNFQLAKSYHVEKICLPIEKVGTISSGLVIYKQPKFSTSVYDLGHTKATLIKEKINVPEYMTALVRLGIHDGYRLDDLWLKRAIQIYGKRFMKSFERWTTEAKINDLHGGNIGFLKRQPIIIDYAGYHG